MRRAADEYVVGPQDDLRVARPAGEGEALGGQPLAQSQAPRGRLDQQQPQLGGAVVLAHAEHAAHRRAIQFGDPAGLAGVGAPRVVRHDPGHQRLVAGVPAVLLRVQRAVALHHPAEIAGPRGAQHERGRAVPRPGDLPDRGHRRGQPLLLGLGELVEQRADLLRGTLVQAAEGVLPGAGQRDDPAAGVGVRAPPGDQAVRLEPGQDPAQVPGVDVDGAAQRADLALAAPGRPRSGPARRAPGPR